jgi:hypothetical protein
LPFLRALGRALTLFLRFPFSFLIN